MIGLFLRTTIIRKAAMPADKDPHDSPLQPLHAPDDDDSLSIVDYLDSVDRAAFRRALGQRNNYYPISRGT
jgi:hypothetical protein